MRAMVRAVLEAFLEGLRPFFMEGVELFELFGSQDSGEGLHPVNAAQPGSSRINTARNNTALTIALTA